MLASDFRIADIAAEYGYNFPKPTSTPSKGIRHDAFSVEKIRKASLLSLKKSHWSR